MSTVFATALSVSASTPQSPAGTGVRTTASAQMTVMLPGYVPLVLVRIPAGTFLMGSPQGERGNVFENETQHQVTLTHDSWVGQTAVTQQQWEAVMGAPMPTDCGTIAVGDDEPVYCVSWDRIAGPGGFVDKLNQELDTTMFRLPTEAEWERAARAGTTTRFSYGDVLGSAFDLQDGAVGALGIVSDSPSLLLMSRTYNQVSGGTFGQAIPGYAASELIQTGTKKRLVFFVENASYRSNLGLMNGTGESIRIQWERFTADGVSVASGGTNLPPWGNKQLNQVFADDAPVVGGYVDVWTDTAGGAFTAYGSMLDNQTSDPTTILPQ